MTTAEKDEKNVCHIFYTRVMAYTYTLEVYVSFVCTTRGIRERETQSTDGPTTDGNSLYSLARYNVYARDKSLVIRACIIVLKPSELIHNGYEIVCRGRGRNLY